MRLRNRREKMHPDAVHLVARRATRAVFAVHAVLFASWTAHIPHVKAALRLSDGALGSALFGAPIGSVLAISVAGWLLPRLGSRLLSGAGMAGYCLVGPLIGLAGSRIGLFCALLLWGVFQGLLGVSMNAQAVVVEKAMGRPVMSGLHGSWSVGAFAGAGLGTLAVAVGVGLTAQIFVLGLASLAGAGWAPWHMLPDRAGSTRRRSDSDSSRAGVLMLGGITLVCMLGEGAAADWSAVYLRDTLRAGPADAGLGYASYAAATVALRFCGDRLLACLAVRSVLAGLTAFAAVGFGCALLLNRPEAALAGFATLGAGLALVVPATFAAAGRLPGVDPGTALAAVSALGWIGFVGGPPVIGQLASRFSLPAALALLPALLLLSAAAIRFGKVFDPAVGRTASPGDHTGSRPPSP